MHEGSLYRPAQDCSEDYGSGVVINKVTTLTTESFKEEATAVINPFEAYPDGIHTLSAVDGISLLDGKRYRYVASLSELRRNLGYQHRHARRRLKV